MENIVGEGSYSVVYKVIEKATGKIFALKELYKMQLLRLNKVQHAYFERDILQELDHENIVKLYGTFQTTLSLCTLFGLIGRHCYGIS